MNKYTIRAKSDGFFFYTGDVCRVNSFLMNAFVSNHGSFSSSTQTYHLNLTLGLKVFDNQGFVPSERFVVSVRSYDHYDVFLRESISVF